MCKSIGISAWSKVMMDIDTKMWSTGILRWLTLGRNTLLQSVLQSELWAGRMLFAFDKGYEKILIEGLLRDRNVAGMQS